MEVFAGRFTLLRALGQGGMGSVWLAVDHSSGAECALKRISSDLPVSERDSLRREFEVLSRVRHPSIVSAFELGFAPDGMLFYTMEYVPGVAADVALEPGDWPQFYDAAAQLAHALEVLHAMGIVHGDVKPSNVLVTHDARAGGHVDVRLLDLGLAALLGRDGRGHRGTPGFAAPEVVGGGPASIASDLYGYGATLYVQALRCAAVTAWPGGKGPRPPHADVDVTLALDEAAVPEPLARLILRLLSRNPAARPHDAREVRKELERLHPAAKRSLSERLENRVLVGRQQELAKLGRWLAIAPRGPAIMLLRSEPGMGRSAILAAMTARASLAGHPVVALSPDGPEVGGAARTLLKRLAIESLAEASADPWGAALLARLEDPAPIGHDWAAHEETAMRWAATVQRTRRALVVCIDDEDRLDPVSRHCLRRLALHPDAGALRWIWSTSSAAADGREEHALLLDSGKAESLVLGPLDRAGSEALVRARLHATPPAELMETLWETTAGHPGLVIETLRSAVAAGAIAETDAEIAVDRDRLSRLPRSDLERAGLGRLQSLGAEVQAAAAALAVSVTGLRGEDLALIEPRAGAGSLESLEHAGLLARNEDGRVSLRPLGLARTLAASLDPVARVGLHRAMLQLDGLLPSQRFAHLAGAGDVAAALGVADAVYEGDLAITLEAARVATLAPADVAARWSERAGRALLDRGRYRESIPCIERALALEPDHGSRGRRWHALSGALLRTGARERLAALHAHALATDLADRERALLLANEAMRRRLEGDSAGAATSAVEALELAERSSDGEAESIAALTLGTIRRLEGLFGEARRLAEQAEVAATRANYPLGRLRAAGQRALCAALEHDTREAERIYRSSLAEARQRNARLAEHELGIDLAWTLVEAGRWLEAREITEGNLRLVLEESWPGAAAPLLANLAMFSALTGRVSGCVRQALAARRMVREHQPFFEAYAWRTLATALRVTGRTRRGLRVARRALALAEGHRADPDLGWCRYEYGRACAVRGRWAEARAIWERGYTGSGAEDLVRPVLATACGRSTLRAGELQAAAGWLQASEAWLERREAPYVKAHVDQLRAELSLARGEPEAGARHAEEALRGFGLLPAPPDAASAALEFARVATRAGIAARTPIPEWLRVAAAGFEGLGDHRQRERALALAVDWYRRRGTTASGPARDRDLLQSVTRLLDSQSDLDEFSRRAMQLAVDQLDAERGVLVLVDDETGESRPMVEHGAIDAATRDQALTYSREIVARVARSGGSLLVGDLTTEPESLTNSMLELGLRSVLCVPMFGAGRVVGVVYLDDSRRAQAFGDAERGLLEGFAHLLAVAIENSRGHDQVRRANEQLVGENLSLRREVGKRFQHQNFIGSSVAMQKVWMLVERAAQVPSTVLVTGENGTGKEMIARLLHYSGPRAMQPFVSVNCGAIAPTLLESELFGILADVATGVRARAGRFVEAHGGTLFLDEIGDMPAAQQVALLSVLANRKVTPVGGGRGVDVDVRVIAATNCDLVQKIAEGSFREELWYRLNVIPIEVPPLREHKADIPALAQHFASMFAAQQGREIPELSPSLLAVLMQSDWPGNVRELQNYIERLMAMTPGGTLQPKPLPHDLERRSRGRLLRLDRDQPLGTQIADLERRQVLSALERSRGNQSQAARELGLTEQSLRYRLRKYAIDKGRRIRRTR